MTHRTPPSARHPFTIDQLAAPAPPPTPAGLPAATPQTATPPAAVDANGFDPGEFEWRPVPRRPRADGWTPDVQRRFIEMLARTSVERACMEVGMSVGSAYGLRHAPGGEGFARAWDATRKAAADRLLDVAFQHALEGEEVPVHDQDGIQTGVRYRYNTRMAMFLLRAYHPERFRYAHRDTRAPDEPPPPAEIAMPQAVATLGPVTPADPHLRIPAPFRDQVIADARKEAAVPVKETCEPWRPRLVPPPHPRVQHRADIRRARRRRQQDREDARLAPGHGDDPS